MEDVYIETHHASVFQTFALCPGARIQCWDRAVGVEMEEARVESR